MKSKEKKRLREEAQARTSISQPTDKGAWKFFLFLGLSMLLAFGSVWGLFELVVWNKIPSEIVGNWEIVDGPHGGDTFEFFSTGHMIGQVYPEGKKGTINAQVRMEGKTLFFTTKHPQTGEATTQSQIIRILTARQMVLEDDQGQTLKLERVE